MNEAQKKRLEALQQVCEAAAETARQRMRTHGGHLVYIQDGVIVEEIPDGIIRPLETNRRSEVV